MKTLASRVFAPWRAWWVLLALACLVLPAFGQLTQVPGGGSLPGIPGQQDQQGNQPDLMVKLSSETTHVGDDIYNPGNTGDNPQVATLRGAVNSFIVHYKLQNDGAAPVAFKVTGDKTGTPDKLGWNYFDAIFGGNDITEQMFGTGWTTPEIPVGGSIEFRAEVVIKNQADLSAFGFTTYAKSLTDSTLVDAVAAGYIKQGTPPPVETKLTAKPDLMVKAPTATEYIGNNVYEARDTTQKLELEVKAGDKGVFLLKLENDGDSTQAFHFSLPQDTEDVTWKIFSAAQDGDDITATVRVPTWKTKDLAKSEAVEYRIEQTMSEKVTAYGSTITVVPVTAGTEGSDQVFLGSKRPQQATPKPDLIIKFNEQIKGDNIYNADAADQRIDAGGVVTKPLTAVIKLQNDGKEKGAFKVSATKPADGAGWTVKFFEPPAGEGQDPKDVTDDVLAGTYNPGEIAPGATKELKVEITAADPAKPKVIELTVKTAAADGTDVLDAVALRYVMEAPTFQPDFWLRKAGITEYVGLDIYANEQGQQAMKASTQIGETVIYLFKVQNDGKSPAKFMLIGSGSSKGWVVSYFNAYDGGDNITANVVGGGYPIAELAAGEYALFRCEITPGADVEAGTAYTVGMLAKSTAGAPRTDTASFVITALAAPVAPVSQPDAAIHALGQDELRGEHVYNDDTEQTVTMLTSRNAPAVYEIVVRNNGNIAESFTLTATAGDADWTVKYFNNLRGGDDITAAITGAAGWTTRELQPLGIVLLRVEVTPSTDVPWNTKFPVAVTAVSTKDGAKADSVIANTICANLRRWPAW